MTRRSLPALFAGSALACCLTLAAAPATAQTLIAADTTWRYWDQATPPPGAFTQAGYNASAWGSGPAPLGYGDDDIITEIGYGPDANNKYAASWYRQSFTLDDPSAVQGLSLDARYDDGVVIYLNGVEVARENLPAGTLLPTTYALSSHEGNAEILSLDPDKLVAGENVLVAQVHQRNATTTDAKWAGVLEATTLTLTRVPYLQQATPTSISIHWRTSIASSSTVTWTSPDGLSQTVNDASALTEHRVALTGLLPSTRYSYTIGTNDTVLAGGDDSHAFVTPPPPSSTDPIRVWVLGDSGTGTSTAAAVRDAYAGFEPNVPTDVWLMLGDNAYNDGTDAEYQRGVFDMFPTFLSQVALWPTLGNHDARSASSATQTGVYYDVFGLPTAGEAGGVPSGTEAYYSFDHAPVHFVCLNSQDVDRSPSGAMATWLHDDLSSNTLPFTVVFFHHPPYTKGSHNSDTESRHIDMRENISPILEQYSVDVVLSGHSHSYERSMLMAGHYGFSADLQSDMILNDGPGASDAPYEKNAAATTGNDGTIYIVAGASAKSGGGYGLQHPVMHISVATRGSLILDIDDEVLTGRYLTFEGEVIDTFALRKESVTLDIVGGDRSAHEGEAISLSAGGIYADDALIWTFDDTSAPQSGAHVTHAFRDNGTYLVTATGGGESDTITVTVNNVAPTVTSAEIQSGIEGSPVWLSASASDVGVLDTASAAWLLPGGGVLDGFDVEYVFEDDGEFPVTLTVTDNDGAGTSMEVLATIENAPPSLALTAPETVAVGAFFNVELAATDPGVLDALTLVTTFGDGASFTGPAPLHAYAAPGVYPLSATVTDDGGLAATATAEITVTDAAVVVPGQAVAIALPATANEGQSIGFGANAPEGATVSWTFGDAAGDDPQAVGASVVHTYADNGAFMVRARARLADESIVEASGAITILDVAPTFATVPPAPETRPFYYLPVVNASATDDLTFTLTPQPAGITFDASTGALTLVDEPERVPLFLALAVTDDDGSTATQTVHIVPQASAPPPLDDVRTPATPADELDSCAAARPGAPFALLALCGFLVRRGRGRSAPSGRAPTR